MALRDRAVRALRAFSSAETDERDKADSPSADAMRQHSPSMFSVWGREDIGGLLTVSQSLMDRFADYEAMEEYPDVNSAYHYYANDATQPSIRDGRTLWCASSDRALQEIGNDLLHKRLRMEDDVWSLAYTTSMMGNDYEELLITENGVIGLNHLPVPTVRRVERLDGGLIGFVQDVTGQFTANGHELRRMLAGQTEIPKALALFEDWNVVHFRLNGTRRRSPYGVSIAEGARWIWKRLVMLEDSVMIYKLTRAPARYAYYVDVTDVPSDRVEGHLRKMKRDLKKTKMVDPRTGRMDMRYSPLARDEDFIVGVREGRELARIEVLSGPDYQAVDDVEYFKRMMHGALRVPREYLGQEGGIPQGSILSNADVRAARVTMNLQRELRNGFERIIRLHLAARGHPAPFKPDLGVEMTVPSGIWELAAYEVLNARADYASRIQPMTSLRYVQENVLKLTPDEIEEIKKQQQDDAQGEEAGEFPSYTGSPPPPPPAPEGEPGGEGQPSADELRQGAPEARAGSQEWRNGDYTRRLEEWRYRRSVRERNQITDKLAALLQEDSPAGARARERERFFSDLKDTVFRRQRGLTTALPTGIGHTESVIRRTNRRPS